MFFPPHEPVTKPETPELPLLHETSLANGLVLHCYDATNRYFGDYHRVVVLVTITLSLDHPTLKTLDPALLAEARRRFGQKLVTRKSLERMGMPSAAVAAVQQKLLASFLQEAQRYLARADYPALLLRSELERQPSRRLLPKLK